MIIYIYGEDSFRSRQFLRKNINDFKKKRDPQGLNTLILDGQKESEDRIVSEIIALPFLAERRMIVIENLLTSNDKDKLGRILDMVEKKEIPESNVVIFWQAEPPSKIAEAKKLSGLLTDKKYVFNSYGFSFLDPSELNDWVIGETKARGGKIERSAAIYLGQNVEKDMWLLNSLLDQLLAYKNGGEIGLADVRIFLDEKVGDNIFQAVESVVAGDKKNAFKLLNKQRQLGRTDAYLFGMILRQFRILLQIRDLWEQEDGTPSDNMAKILGLHPFVVKKSLPLVKRYSMARLKEHYGELLEIDIKTKTGLAEQGVLIDYFIGKI